MVEGYAEGSLTFSVASFIISLTCIFCAIVIRKKRNIKNRLLITLLLIVFIDSCTGIASNYAYNYDHPYAFKFVVCYLSKYIYYATHFLMMPILLYYIIIVCGIYHIFSRDMRIFFAIPMGIVELVLFSNPMTRLGFTADSDLVFHRGPVVYAAYILSAFYFILCVLLLARYWKYINHLKKGAMVYFLSLAIVGVIIQLLFPTITCEIMLESIGLMGIMIILEKDDDRIDTGTGLLNRTALLQDIKNYIALNRSFRTICVRIENAEAYINITGYAGFDAIIKQISKYLFEVAEKYDVYISGVACFYILCVDATENESNKLAYAIRDRFDKSWKLDDNMVNINAVMLCAGVPDMFVSEEDILMLSEAYIENESKNILIGHDLDFLLRKIDVEKAIARGMNKNYFNVKYRPLFDKTGTNICGAEALLYLNDSVLGEVSFDEFMSVAEKAGFTEEIENRMIGSIFKFAGELFEENSGCINFILVHTVSSEIISKEFVGVIREYAKQYNVDLSRIAIDINDNVLYVETDSVSYIIERLREDRVKIFMGSYNSDSMGVRYDVLSGFNGVVVNIKNFMENAGGAKRSIILKNRMDMLKQINKTVIVTDVDSFEYYDKIKDIYADYILGDYLSPAVSKAEFMEMARTGKI
ncbi:MAG: EAL domain-containing protein [Butyrivibrio sp.]|nr:EAL domain-containing protein [Butyrivibrio sp.]